MDSLKERGIQLISRSPLWAIRPDSLLGIFSGVMLVFAEALKPQTMGSSKSKVSVIPVQGVLSREDAWAGST
jgi:hypothetical protein